MPVQLNSSLLSQLTQAPTSPIKSGIQSFLVTQEQVQRNAILRQRREEALLERQMQWDKYVQERAAQQQAEQNRTMFQSEIAGLDLNTAADRTRYFVLANKYGQPVEGVSMLPSLATNENPEPSTWYNRDGNPMVVDESDPVAVRNAIEAGYITDKPTKPEGETIRDRKISDLVARGIPRDDAVDIVDGHVRMEVVEQTGMVRLTNVVDQTAKEIPIGGTAPEVPDTTQPGPTLFEEADKATGIKSGVLDLWSRIAGQIGEGAVAEETVAARTLFETSLGELRRALSINPRFPVGEMERIEEEIRIKPSIFDSGPALRERMKTIDVSLRRRLRDAERDAADTSLPQETRSSQAANASAIRNFLRIMGVPKGDTGTIGDLSEKESRELMELRRKYGRGP